MKLSEVGGDTTAPERRSRLSQVGQTTEVPEGEPRPGTASEATTQFLRSPVNTRAAGEDLIRGGKEIILGAGNLVGNFVKWLSLPPSEERTKARGEFFGQLGDIGTFVSGGLTGPLSVPQQASGLQRGLNIQPPRRAEVPTPQPALPPPARIPTPGAPAISTGEGIIPPRQPGTMTSPAATPGGASTVGPPQPLPRAPGPAFGQSAADIAGGLAGRDLPPRAPGTEGRAPLAPERQARQTASTDSFLDNAAKGQPSQLASAFVNNDPSFPNRALTRQYRTAVGRGQVPRSGPRLDMQDQQITTAIDTLIEGKDQIQFRDPRDPTGNARLPSGRVPQNLNEFAQGIDQLKGQIFKEYDQLARGQGARVELGPTINKLREMAISPEIRDISPNIAQQALAMADRFERLGSYSPLEAQNVVQSLNAELAGFLKRGAASQEVFSHPTLMNEVRNSLLDSLNGTMEKALGDPRYQALRIRYGALSSIEGNVANALSKELSKSPGFFNKVWTASELAALAHGAVFFNPKVIGSAAAMEAARALTRYIYNPNRAVAAMFNARARELAPRAPYLSERLSAGTGRYLSEGRQSAFDRSIANQPYVGTSGM